MPTATRLKRGGSCYNAAMTKTVHVIGGGLAGSEAAWQLARAGVPVVLHEMRPDRGTDAHLTDGLAELVCSNSFRSDDAEGNAVGLLHEEMRRAGSLILQAADATRLPAGGALAVDRDEFSKAVEQALANESLVEIVRGEIDGLPPADWDSVIVATGPLTSPALAQTIQSLSGEESLAFFDAIAPIVHKDSIDFKIAWMQSRYDKIGPAGTGADYINCPLDEAQYQEFLNGLETGEKTEFKEWEESTPYFEGCLPIEVMASRGPETLRFGPMKPVGLTDPNTGKRAHAVVQLRQDNALGTLYNMVGFQTKLRHGAQTEIFRKIPGLENAKFARLGGLHRNTFLNSPRVLDPLLRLKADPRLRFAGQITGVEGYVESAAIGLLAGRAAAAERTGGVFTPPPTTTAMGALLSHITVGADAETFQPMNINFGLFPPFTDRKRRGRDRKRARSEQALREIDGWLGIPPKDASERVVSHYAVGNDLGERLIEALRQTDRDLEHLTPRDLAPLDQLHTRGWPATVEQAEEFGFTPDMHVLDVGCGIGGPARYIAHQFGCRVTGVDLTADYVRAAKILTAQMGLSDKVDFQCANALALPFQDQSFDAVWSQNVSMNIADSLALYREFHRVLKQGGKVLMAEMAQGPGGPLHFPVPWARKPDISFLQTPDEIRQNILAAGLEIVSFVDDSETVIEWSKAQALKPKPPIAPVLKPALVFGDDFPERARNSTRNLNEQRALSIRVIGRRI
jgi:methylenetetrahydrofolate--tRNA-(uracil-5-)-methyltransferase